MPEKKEPRKASRQTVDAVNSRAKEAKEASDSATSGLIKSTAALEKVLEAASDARFRTVDEASNRLASILSPKGLVSEVMLMTTAKVNAEAAEDFDIEAELISVKNAFGVFDTPVNNEWVIEAAPERVQLPPSHPTTIAPQ